MQMQRSAVIGAIAISAVVCIWIGTVATTARGSMICPSTPAWLAAGMRITTVSSFSCDKVMSEMGARVDGQSSFLTQAWKDPHENGWYSNKMTSRRVDEHGSRFSFSTSHRTGDGKHLDNQIFTLTPRGVGCKIEACSRSQIGSPYDDGTNYCSLKMLFCGAADGCKFLRNDLRFWDNETTSKFYRGSVNLKKCLGSAASLPAEGATGQMRGNPTQVARDRAPAMERRGGIPERERDRAPKMERPSRGEEPEVDDFGGLIHTNTV